MEVFIWFGILCKRTRSYTATTISWLKAYEAARVKGYTGSIPPRYESAISRKTGVTAVKERVVSWIV